MKTEALEVLKNRRAIRRYKSEQVSREELEAVLEAGTYAPTGVGTQGVQIIAVQSPEYLARVKALNASVLGRDGDPYYGAPTIILVLETEECKTHTLDGAAACTNMLNAAYAAGLGSCWIHRAKEVFEDEEGRAILREIGIPDEYEGIGNLVLGYAAVENKAVPERREGRLFKK